MQAPSCSKHRGRAATGVVLTVVAASLSIAAGMRYHRLLSKADGFQANENLLHEELMTRQKKLAVMDRERFTKEIPQAEASLRDNVSRLFTRLGSAYSTSVIFYRTSVDDLENQRVRGALQEIFGNRISYAMASGNEEETTKWLEFIKGRIGTRHKIYHRKRNKCCSTRSAG